MSWLPSYSPSEARLRLSSLWLVLGGSIAVVVFAAVLGHSTKDGVLILLGICFLPLALWQLPLAVCGWTIVTFLSHVSALSAYPNRVMLFTAVCWLGLLMGRRSRARSPLADSYVVIAIAVLFTAWVVISLAWASVPGAGETGTHLKQFLYGGFSLLLLLGVIVERRHVRWLASAFVVGATLSVLYGAAKGGLSAGTGVATEVADSGGRFQGGASDPNYLAAVLVPALMIAGGLAIGAAPRHKALLALAAVIITIGLAATESRGGLIAAIVCAAVAFVIWRERRALIAGLIGLIGASTAIFFLAKPSAWTRILESNQGSGRLDIWTVAVRIIHAHPFAGVGFGQFQQVSIHYVLQPGALQYIGLIIEQQIVVHNVYLQMWVEEGIVGLLLFLVLVTASLASAWFAVKRFDLLGDVQMAAMARATVLALVGILVASFFLSDLENSQLWIMLALGPVLAAIAKRQSAQALGLTLPAAPRARRRSLASRF
jgi:O-antigen ligase